MLVIPRFGWVAILAILLSVTVSYAKAESVLVFAAASAAPAIRAASASFTDKTGITVTVSGAATSALAQQIMRGAPAQIFVSAHPRWINHLAERKVIDHARQTTLLGNDLVLIAPKDSNLGALDLHALVDVRPQALERNPDGKFALYRVGDAVAGRNIHAAIYDSLRLCVVF